MKKTFNILAVSLLTLSIFLAQEVNAQSPEKMTYQAVIRNSSNQLVSNQSVGMQISILQYTTTGTAVYVETQSPITNANGLLSIEIGSGSVISGNFSSINWANGPYFIKTETDPTSAGGTNYSISGTSQFLSVPYALHAKTADSITGSISENDPIFNASIASGITAGDTSNWNSKLDNYTESQTLADVLSINNDGNANRIVNIANPIDSQDVATKAYVDELKTMILDLQAAQGVIDINGNHYNAIRIGTQIWMSENLRTNTYNDGSSIAIVTSNSTWINLNTGAYCWYNNDSATYENPYGKLYNWYTVNTGNLCPIGWHVPNDAEWTILSNYLGGASVAGGKMKENGVSHWFTPNLGATNESGFTALPNGGRMITGTFSNLYYYNYLWSANETSASDANCWYLYFNSSILYTNDEYKVRGHSVRCIKD